MNSISPGGARGPLRALCLSAAVLLAACASDPGEKVADAPFPDLADAPSRPQASTTAEERAAMRRQLETRRVEINRVAESLLEGGTDAAPVALESRLPGPPPGTAPAPPPPLPEGLPPPPRRPELAPDAIKGGGEDGADEAGGEADKGGPEAEDQ